MNKYRITFRDGTDNEGWVIEHEAEDITSCIKFIESEPELDIDSVRIIENLKSNTKFPGRLVSFSADERVKWDL